MNNLSKILAATFIFLSIMGCKNDDGPLLPPPQDIGHSCLEDQYDNYGIDTSNNLIVYNGNPLAIPDQELILGDCIFNIETTDEELSTGKEYTMKRGEKEYKLFHSEIPIVLITTYDVEILDDPKISGKVKLFEPGAAPYESFIGIELRGGFSQTYPKKSYSMELWEDDEGDEKAKVSLMGMREDDDWILDGLWNEPNRIRDVTSHDLWLEMGRVQDPREDTKTGIAIKYVELFVNAEYKGIYYLSEKIDKKQLNLKGYDNQVEGELYKGFKWADGVSFDGVEEFDNSLAEWSGYEAKYPDNIGELDWGLLQEQVDFVVNSSQAAFNNDIFNRFDEDNVIDYYLFINLVYATDNLGKNVYTGKFSSSSLYFFLPWDMDGTFGNNWRGERKNITDEMLSNGLFSKLLNSSYFKTKTKERWFDLRASTFSNDNIKQTFRAKYEYLLNNGIYKREALVPDLPQYYSTTEIDFIETWTDERLLFLDQYFSAF
ncbi:MAG: CotH kinase family protein [Saprospiraceae bacterium]